MGVGEEGAAIRDLIARKLRIVLYPGELLRGLVWQCFFMLGRFFLLLLLILASVLLLLFNFLACIALCALLLFFVRRGLVFWLRPSRFRLSLFRHRSRRGSGGRRAFLS